MESMASLMPLVTGSAKIRLNAPTLPFRVSTLLSISCVFFSIPPANCPLPEPMDFKALKTWLNPTFPLDIISFNSALVFPACFAIFPITSIPLNVNGSNVSTSTFPI